MEFAVATTLTQMFAHAATPAEGQALGYGGCGQGPTDVWQDGLKRDFDEHGIFRGQQQRMEAERAVQGRLDDE